MADNFKIIFNGDMHSVGEAAVSATSRGVMYGDGCFETMRSYRGHVLKLDAHLDRLEKGLDFLSIRYPKDLQKAHLCKKLQALLAENNLTDKEAIFRLQVWRKGERGYSTTAEAANYSITATPLAYQKKTCQLVTVDIQRVPSRSLPSCYKLSSGTNYIIAAQQAAQQGGDDALLETRDGNVSESTIANIFWMKEGVVYTPSIDCDILPGITRRIILDILRERLNVETQEGHFTIDAVKQADAVWLSNSLKEVQSVSGLDEVEFTVNSHFLRQLKKAYTSFKTDHLKMIGA